MPTASPSLSNRRRQRTAPLAAAIAAAIEPLECRRLLAVDLISVALGGGSANGASGEASVSTDGRYVAFSSDATNLVNGDGNGKGDVFLRDRQSGTTTLVSANSANTGSSTGKSFAPAISADGRYVAFVSEAADIVDGDTNGRPDVFIRDTQTNTTRLVTRSLTGGFGNGFAGEPSISANGQFVSFTSNSTNLTVLGDTNNRNDVYVRDMNAGTTKIISVNTTGNDTGNEVSFDSSMSADGRYVAFRSKATNIGGTIVPNNAINVFLRDTQTNATTLISVNQSGTSGSADSTSSSVSADGQSVVFRSVASDLTPKDNNNTDDVFLRSVSAGTTTLLSINRQRTASGRGRSEFPSVSSDGHFAAFSSFAPDLVETDANGKEDVFLRDLQAGPITLLSTNTSGAAANGHSFDPFVSSNGQFVVFSSDATDLVSGDGNGATDIFATGTPQPSEDTTPPTAAVSTTQEPATNELTFYDFNVDLHDDVALNTVSVGNVTVTLPDNSTQTATLQGVLGSGKSAIATYRINAPGGAIDAADNGTYQVAVGANAIKDAAGNVLAAGSIGSFTITAADPNSPDLVATISGKIPDSVIGGKSGKVKVAVKNQGINIAQQAGVKTSVYLSDNDTLDAGDREVGSVTKNLKLKTGKSKSYSIKFKFPSDVGNGGYFLIAKADSGNAVQEVRENNNASGALGGKSGNPIDLKQPFIDLTPINVARPVGTLTANGGAVAVVTLKNQGNVKFSNTVAIKLVSSSDPNATGDDVEVTTFSKKLSISAGKTKAAKIKFTFPAGLAAGTYSLIATVDPTNATGDTDTSNNTGTSATYNLT